MERWCGARQAPERLSVTGYARRGATPASGDPPCADGRTPGTIHAKAPGRHALVGDLDLVIRPVVPTPIINRNEGLARMDVVLHLASAVAIGLALARLIGIW